MDRNRSDSRNFSSKSEEHAKDIHYLINLAGIFARNHFWDTWITQNNYSNVE